MGKGRLEAFSDGVLAIIITIMVLDLKVPAGDRWYSLQPLVPVFLNYALSFVFVGVYWNNHHHMLSASREVSGRVLWANLHLLFWLSLIPFTTNWMGNNHDSPAPVATYGAVLLMSGIAYKILAQALIASHAADSPLAEAIGADRKGFVSLAIYSAAIPLAFFNTWFSIGLYVLVAMLWFTPDPRIEKTLRK